MQQLLGSRRKGWVRGTELLSACLPPVPASCPCPLTCGAGAAVGTHLLQAVNESICLQLQILHQLRKGVSGGPPPRPSRAHYHRVLLRTWAAYLPERVKLGAFRDAVLAGLVLADEIVVHGFPIDQGQRVCALLLPGPQPEGRGGVSLIQRHGGLPVPRATRSTPGTSRSNSGKATAGYQQTSAPYGGHGGEGQRGKLSGQET